MKLEFLFGSASSKPPIHEDTQAQYADKALSLLVILSIVFVYYIVNGMFRFIRSAFEELALFFTPPVARTHQGHLNAVADNSDRNDTLVNRKSAEEVNDILRKSFIPLKDIMDIVECMVCLETISVPFSMCIKGHLVCNNCVKKINKCPTCQETIAKTVPICIKQLVEIIPYLCPNSGCDRLVKSNVNHEKYCKKRLIFCQKSNCKRQVIACDLLKHQELLHKEISELKKENPGVLKWPNFNSANKSEHILFFQFFNGLYSLEMIKIGTLLNITFHAVYNDDNKPGSCFAILETEKNGLNFNCTLKPSMTEDASDECAPSMEVSQKYIAQFLSLNGELSLKYEIKPRQ